MRGTITGSNPSGAMTLGDLRDFIASLDGLPDDAAVKARTTLVRRRLRSITVEEEDITFHGYLEAVAEAPETGAPLTPSSEPVSSGDDDVDPPDGRRRSRRSRTPA